MGLHIHRSERADALVEELATLLADVPADPFTPEVIAIPGRGMERYVSQRLGLLLGAGDGTRSNSASNPDGICAHVDFRSFTELSRVTVAEVLGLDADEDPWSPTRLTWLLMELVEDSAADPRFGVLRAHLGYPPAGEAETEEHQLKAERRLPVCRQIAILLNSYASMRPDMLAAWAEGSDVDGTGAALPESLAWQPELFRLAAQRLPLPPPNERMAQVCDLLAAGAQVSLPARLSAFAPGRIPADQLNLLEALGKHREVHLWLVQPSSKALEAATPRAGGMRRADDSGSETGGDAAKDPLHPLLRSFGRESRELAMLLGGRANSTIAVSPAAPAQIPADASALSALQRSIRQNAAVPEQSGRAVIDPEDRSIQLHSCHGPARQAEVVREAILGLLETDPQLEPRDIVIMCPDVDLMAPLLSAAFAEPGQGPLSDLRLHIAENSRDQANDLLAALESLFDLLPGRFTLTDVLGFVELPAVSRRYGLDEDALIRLRALCTEASIRWGLDESHRDEFKVRMDVGTWRWGLDRLLLGAALSEDGLPSVNNVLPVDSVGSKDIEIIGALADIVDRLESLRAATTGRHAAQHWIDALGEAFEGLMLAEPENSWQLSHALGSLYPLHDAAALHPTVTLSRREVRWALRRILEGRPAHQRFASGGITVCGLRPLRAVPHKVICLVGLDDGAFPRGEDTSGDNILRIDPFIGDPDARMEDRQTLLDTIMAATDALVITYTGNDARTNESQPPSVPVGEILDALDAYLVVDPTCADPAASSGDDKPSSALLHSHPLQPFDPRNFGGAGGKPFSHDQEALAGARALVGTRTPKSSFSAVRAPALVPPRAIDPLDLGKYLSDPAGWFVRNRLMVPLPEEDRALPVSLPLKLQGLERWGAGERMRGLLMQDLPLTRIQVAEAMRGSLPVVGQVEALVELSDAATAVATAAAKFRVGDPEQHRVRIELPTNGLVEGLIGDVFGDRIVRVSFSKVRGKQRVQIWPSLLALTVSLGRPAIATCIGEKSTVTLKGPDPERALRILDWMVGFHLDASDSIPPLPIETTATYAEARSAGKPWPAAFRAAANKWQGAYSDSDFKKAAMPFAAYRSFDDLLAEPPRPREALPNEETRFGALAMRLWHPIMAAEVGDEGRDDD